MNKTGFPDSQAPVFLPQYLGDTVYVGVQGRQYQRNPLLTQDFKGLTALPHHSVEQLDILQMGANMRVEINVVEQRENIATAAQYWNTAHCAEGRPAPTVEGHVDTRRARSFPEPAQHPRLRKPIQGIDHLPKQLALSALPRKCIRGVADQGVFDSIGCHGLPM